MKISNEYFLNADKELVEQILPSDEWNRIRSTLFSKQFDVIDLFSGCGGMSYGFYLLGKIYNVYRHIAAIDIDKHSNKTFNVNLKSEAFNYDLGNIQFDELDKIIKSQQKGIVNPIILIGCAPCQGFSAHRKKDPRKDSRNSLVGSFGEIVVHMKPEFVIMENVPDLLSKKHVYHFNIFKNLLEGAGYNLSVNVVNMANYGVPQKRYRTLVLASRKLKPIVPPEILDSENFRTVRDAIGHLEPIEAGCKVNKDPMHITSNHREETIRIISQIPEDGGFRPKGVGPKCLDKVKGFSDVYGRLFWNKPSVTITSRCRTPSTGRFTHPYQNRGLSVREAALLQGFPSSYFFEGPFDDKFKQIGNAVPPLFSVNLAIHILRMLEMQGIS